MAACYFATAKLGYENLKDESTITSPLNIAINLRDRFEKILGRRHVALLYSMAKIYMEYGKDTKLIDLIKKINFEMGNNF